MRRGDYVPIVVDDKSSTANFSSSPDFFLVPFLSLHCVRAVVYVQGECRLGRNNKGLFGGILREGKPGEFSGLAEDLIWEGRDELRGRAVSRAALAGRGF